MFKTQININLTQISDSRIGREFSLPAQSVLELGLIECELNNRQTATKLLNQCLYEYTGYANENYVQIRAYAALRGLGAIKEHEDEDEGKCMSICM